VRREALDWIRTQLAVAFGDDADDPVTGQLAQFVLAAMDGAFVAHQTDPQATLEHILLPLARSLGVLRETLCDSQDVRLRHSVL
jgi:hypothetical protein